MQWLALGRTQLHLFERDIQPTSHHHLAVTVDDVQPVYRAAKRWNAFEYKAFGSNLVELPGDVVQLYVRDPEDPAGNCAAGCSCPDELEREVVRLVVVSDVGPLTSTPLKPQRRHTGSRCAGLERPMNRKRVSGDALADRRSPVIAKPARGREA